MNMIIILDNGRGDEWHNEDDGWYDDNDQIYNILPVFM